MSLPSARITLFPTVLPPEGSDPELDRVESWFRAQAGHRETFGTAIRQAYDEILDGQRTGRYDVRDLNPQEQAYIGTKVEIIIQDAFELEHGGKRAMDYVVAGVPVDCKWSKSFGGWMIPTEAMGHICLLTWASDLESRFSIGLVRIREPYLTAGGNKDSKRSITAAARTHIRWLVDRGELPENLLLHLDAETRADILRPKSGQARVNELFRRVQGRLIRREVVFTIGKQTDSPKRVRDARLHLHDEGVRILGHQEGDPAVARRLGLPVPRKGEWVSYQVADYPGDS